MSTQIDLHIHTNASDGAWGVEEAFEEVKKKGLSAFAISDHDSIKYTLKAKELGDEAGITSVNAVELCSRSFGREYHILAYDIDLENPSLEKLLKRTIRARDLREIRIIEMAKKEFPEISMADFEAFMKEEQVGGVPSVNYLKGLNLIDKDSYFRFRDGAYLADWENLLPSEDVIFLLKEIAPVVVLAHPSYYFPRGVMDENMLDIFRNWGVNGLECYSTYNPNKEQNDYYLNYCRKYDFAVSGGSDCHGPFFPEREIGKPYVSLESTNVLARTNNYKHLQPNPIF